MRNKLRTQGALTGPRAPQTLPSSPASPLRHPAPRQGPTWLPPRYAPTSPPHTVGLVGCCLVAGGGAQATYQGHLVSTARPAPLVPQQRSSHGETTPTSTAPLSRYRRQHRSPQAGAALLRQAPPPAPPPPAVLTNPRCAPRPSAPPHWRSALNPWAENGLRAQPQGGRVRSPRRERGGAGGGSGAGAVVAAPLAAPPRGNGGRCPLRQVGVRP